MPENKYIRLLKHEKSSSALCAYKKRQIQLTFEIRISDLRSLTSLLRILPFMNNAVTLNFTEFLQFFRDVRILFVVRRNVIRFAASTAIPGRILTFSFSHKFDENNSSRVIVAKIGPKSNNFSAIIGQKDQTTLSIDKVTKKKAEQMAKKMHLTLSGVARILLNDFADGKIQIATVMITRDENNFTLQEKNYAVVILLKIGSHNQLY